MATDLEEKDKKLEELKKEVLLCQRCPLYQTRHLPVVGEGNHDAAVMFIGEAPGFNEDRTGHPFWGAAGKIFDELLTGIGMKREDIYICNVLKCRPPNNRNPKIEEIKACAPFLDRQIEIIQPKVICTLGNFSTKYILEKYDLGDKVAGISKLHGQVFTVQNLFGSLKIMPLYHTAAATYNPNMKPILKRDFEILKELLLNDKLIRSKN